MSDLPFVRHLNRSVSVIRFSLGSVPHKINANLMNTLLMPEVRHGYEDM